MAKDLIIGGASNYTWNELKHWVNSIKRSGFAGDIVLVSTAMTKETIDKLVSEGVKLALYGKELPNGDFISHSHGAPHVERFFYIWDFLTKSIADYDYVIATDTRDVVFQKDPSDWLSDFIFNDYGKKLIVASEGMCYEDEPWNSGNLDGAFGPFFHNHYKSMTIHNVGVIAGEIEYVRNLFFMIFQMSINRPIPVVDQVVFNVLLMQKPFSDITKFTENAHAWSAQLATTIEAVKSGKGDLGMMVTADPSKLELYEKKYFDTQPKMVDGIVMNHNDEPFVIVHQYDRTLAWKDEIMKRYE